MYRICASCGLDLPQSSYTANQYSKREGSSRCAVCIHGHYADRPRTEVSDAGRHSRSNLAHFTHTALKNPFAQGGFRWVAKGEYTSGPRVGQTVVTKWFKTGVVFSADYFTLDIKAVDRALDIVNRFNQLNIINKTVTINVPAVWAFENDGSGDWSGSRALMEPFIHNYQKFNSNTGWQDDSLPWAQVMGALSHFSYHITGGNFVLCDLQGGIYQQEVILSDPVILSRDRSFGVTDLGPEGISSFFSQHFCNSFCRSTWTAPAKPVRHFLPVPGTSMMQHSVPTHRSRPIGTSRLR